VKQSNRKQINFLSTPLIRRALAFAVIFVMVSGLLGPRLISSGLLYRYHFDVYGGLGKATLFGATALGILISRRQDRPDSKPWKYSNTIWLVLALLSCITAEISINHLVHGSHGAFWPTLTHLSLLASIVFALCGCFGLTTLISLIRTYKKELLISIGLAVAFYALLLAVYGLWKVLAAVVLHSVKWLLGLLGLPSAILPPRTLLFDKFGIDVAQYCSGIESIALFTGLYAIIAVLDWPKFNHRKLLVAFPIALLILFGFNILRVSVLILAGYYINPHIAFSLFHTYAGMIFFIVYAGIFWTLFYKRLLLREPQISHKQKS
jgi:exosortase/archaeosortase family protein